MKKSLCVSALLFLFLSGSLLAQSEFWAAKKLSEVFTEKNKENLKIPENQAYAIITEAVKDYLDALKLNDGYIENNLANTNERKPDVDAIKNKIREYLNFILEEKPIRLMSDQEIKLQKLADKTEITRYSSQLRESFSPVSTTSSGFSITNLADGMAKFLVERTKEELNAAFIKKFQDVITSEKNRFIRDLFPQTYSLLFSLADQIYYYRNYLQNLRAAFLNDLDSIGFKIVPFFLNDEYFNIASNIRPGLKELLILANETIKKIMNGDQHPGEIIEAIDLNKIADERLVRIRQGICAVKIISKSLRNKANDGSRDHKDSYWVDKNNLIDFYWNDKNEFKNLKIYLGLIRLRLAVLNNDIYSAQERKTFSELFDQATKEKNLDVLNLLKKIFLRAVAVDESLVAINNKSEWELTFDDYHKLYGAVLDVLDSMQELNVTLNGDENLDINGFLVSARAFGQIALAIKQKEYCSIVNHIVLILDKVFKLPPQEKAMIIASIKDNNGTNKEEKAALTAKVSGRDKKITKIRNIIAGYGPFICAVANAENSTQIKEAIEAIVLPAGSSNIKKTTPFSLALNAYVGGSLGPEWKSGQKWASMALNIYGPLGIAFSIGNSKTHDSLSFYLPLIDLGALISHRFTSEENEGLPQFVFKNIISPGFYVVAGISGIPLSIGFGIHHGPELVEITDQSATLKTRPWRVGFFLAVDIPLINFWTAFPN